jgi:hypothetical protein
MNVGAPARQHDAVYDVEQRCNIRDLGRPREHHGQGIGDIRHSAKVPFPDPLYGGVIARGISGPDHTD